MTRYASWMVAAVCLLAAGAASATPSGTGALADLPSFKNYKAERQSSYDPSGGNADGRQDWPIAPGETRTMAEIPGAGAITHIWVTIASNDPHHLRNLVLRMYWDGEESPSVECPIGDFFGLGHAQYYQYASLPIQIGTQNGLNCFWHMPFADGARVTVTNDGPEPVRAFYYYVDYRKYDEPPADAGRFHAQYRQAFPCPEGENYVFLEATGKGHFVGCNLSIHLNEDGWWGEGDDMIYIDGAETPALHGTGSEDYFCGAWCYGPAFSNLYFGCPLRGEHERDAYWNVYRYHIDDPIPFEKSIQVTIEHGHANDRADNFSSVAYWYQSEPHALFPTLPPAEERISKLTEAPPVFKEADAFEAEDGIDGWKGGPVSKQSMVTFGKQWSGNAQAWFTPDKPTTYTGPSGEISAKDAGTYRVEQWSTVAPDYGICEWWINGKRVYQWDAFKADGVARVKHEFTVTLEPGPLDIEFRITGKNEESTGYFAGIDCWRVTKQ